MKPNIIPRSFGTHDGPFHADEITACSLLLLYDLIDRDKIIRTRNQDELEKLEFVCDVGGICDPDIKRFDHHQVDYKGTMSSAGMILKYLLKNKFMDEVLYGHINRSLVIGIDAIDNGLITQRLGHCSFSGVITNFVPCDYGMDSAGLFKAFSIALDFAYGHIKRLQERFFYIKSCREFVNDSMKKGQDYLLFDEAMPWMENFFELEGESHPALFVVMPSGEFWKLRGIPPSFDQKMKVRQPLPKHWAGLLEEDLKKVTNIPGAIFCHKGRFISIWKTKEDALKAFKLAVKK
ncbi:hypothetical protein COB11_05900 [Candidatus Aerophobetes bacterium]|uniref:MYG1 family protein n=1 Tax=Aerophobetes bacterium TaxID=2030807 RepID=A0A2A4YE46_UNCAE|nr:MAG: hypothetical protein COB11_05900 [Candidatus Aerophobetes bacterium]